LTASLLNVLVTGGSRGLGLATSQMLAANGYRVIAVARKTSEELEAAAATARDAGRGTIEFRACDLSDVAQLKPLVRSMRADFGPIYGLINNAGLGTSGLLSTMRDADIERLIRLNSIAPIVLTKYVARLMMTERNGRIVNISSIVASVGYSGLSVYSATKASLVGFTRSLARELGPLGITVNAIAPGFIDTAMTGELTAAQRDQIERRSALKRMVDAADVARSVDFLLGSGGRNITGIVLTVDAGNTV
jgi:3-oxoacyl-[acyl-carrier protein] reductase